jgi:predicted RNA binding protein YcfA (HicA-like mRNA interferase family)
VNPKRLLARLAVGQLHNVSFRDMSALVGAFGFRLMRTEGSHHIYGHEDIEEQLNLQEVQGEAKPYQIRQFLRIVERYNLRLRS